MNKEIHLRQLEVKLELICLIILISLRLIILRMNLE
jgi:hypothetical protein